MSVAGMKRSESPGALQFHRSPNHHVAHLCGWAACNRRSGRYAKAGRWRVTMLGYPWPSERGNGLLYVCDGCRRDMTRLWAEACERWEEKAA